MDWSIEDILRFFREPPPPDWKYREKGLIHRGIDHSLGNMIPVAEEQAKRIALAEMETQKARQERSNRLREGWAADDAELRAANAVAPSVTAFNDAQTDLGNDLYKMITGSSPEEERSRWRETAGGASAADVAARAALENVADKRSRGVTVGKPAPGTKSMVEEGPPQKVYYDDPVIEIGGVKYDPVLEEASLMPNANLEKIAAIKAEGKIKSAVGDLKFDAKQHPQYEELKAKYLENLQAGELGGGSFIQAAYSPEVRQREMERDFWLAGGGNRLAKLMMSQQETMDDPESMAAAELLRKESAEELESVRMQHGLTLLEAAKDESGLISPTAAWNYEQITGEPVPEQLRGLDEWGARQEIFKIRSQVEFTASQMSQGRIGSSGYRESAIRAIQEAMDALNSGQNPNVVIAQLQGKIAIAGGQAVAQPQPMQPSPSTLGAYNAGGPWSHGR